MKPTHHFACALFLFLLLIEGVAISHGEERVTDLQQKMADISLLQSQLNERKNEAIEIREKLYGHLSALNQEIESITAREKINSFKAAGHHPRIRNNLQLCSEIFYYIDQFNQKIRFFQIGQDKLDYLYQQADDDLKIINTLTHLKIEALLAQIDAVVFEYLPEAHRILIDFDTFTNVSLETVWEKITRTSSPNRSK